MFEPKDQVTHPDLDGVLTVVSYQGRTQVEVETSDGEQLTLTEHTLDRYIAPKPEPEPRPPRKPSPPGETVEDYFDLRKRLGKAAAKMELDWKGHWLRGAEWFEESWYDEEPKRREQLVSGGYSLDIMFVCAGLNNEQARGILAAHESGEPLSEWLPLFERERNYCCPYCRGHHMFETNGLMLRPVEDCPNPDGILSEALLNIPSGKIVASDSLFDLNPLPTDFEINSVWGQHLRFVAHAKQREILGQVGNSSPTILKLNEGHFQIGRFQRPVWMVTENGEEKWVYEQPADRTGKYAKYGDDTEDHYPEGGEKVGSICTDRWSYAIMDHDEAKHRAEYFGVDWEKRCNDWTFNVIEVEPGTYRFRHYNKNSDAPYVVVGEFERVGDATEQEDWVKMWSNFQVTVGQAVQIRARKKPLLYGGGRSWEGSCSSYLSSAFRSCVPPRDWNPNGFRNDFLPEDLEGIEDRPIPRFRHKGFWRVTDSIFQTTVSRKNKMFGGDAPMNPSHANAALKVLESVISFGARRESISQMREAVRLFYGILDRYPDAGWGLEDFVAWMQDRDAVGLWVENFNHEEEG